MTTNFTILLVDDDPNILEIMKLASKESFPEAKFFHVDSYHEAAKYLDNLEGLGPNLILLDINLHSEPSGIEFLALMRKHPVGRLVPVVMLTAVNKSELAQESYRQGANAFTIKPFSYNDWKKYVGELRTYWLTTATVPRLRFGK